MGPPRGGAAIAGTRVCFRTDQALWGVNGGEVWDDLDSCPRILEMQLSHCHACLCVHSLTSTTSLSLSYLAYQPQRTVELKSASFDQRHPRAPDLTVRPWGWLVFPS